MKFYSLNCWFLLTAVVLTAGMAQAITIDMVPVGNINNPSDSSTGYGSVSYNYNISKCETTAGQYVDFLNAVAPGGPGTTTDPYGLYNSNMASPYSGSPITYNSVTHAYTASLPSQPVNWVSWADAARFCNWLQTGTTETGAYTLNGHTDDAYLLTVTRNVGATYFIPTENEWYKAAYYDPNKVSPGVGGYWLYPTKSNTAPTNVYPSTSTNNANYWTGTYGTYTLGVAPWTTPVGSFANSLSAYGTLDQGGNVFEWNETVVPVVGGFQRGVRGGAYNFSAVALASSYRSLYYASPGEIDFIGFRVASVPEPGSLALLVCGAITGLIWWWRRV